MRVLHDVDDRAFQRLDAVLVPCLLRQMPAVHDPAGGPECVRQRDARFGQRAHQRPQLRHRLIQLLHPFEQVAVIDNGEGVDRAEGQVWLLGRLLDELVELVDVLPGSQVRRER